MSGTEALGIGGNNLAKALTKEMKLLIKALFVIILLALICDIFSNNFKIGIDFNEDFSSISSEPWCDITDDNSCMEIIAKDHNIEALIAIKSANEELGFNDSLYVKMENTSSLDGMQTEENNKIEVSWKFHPDTGLQVIYAKK